ncbi:OLC1v1026064C1 [Oldenlandia corymbosa var. corymbosa]|uniref:OLC1v1026064C1 n=1 Tax=Oldenlandia corymbosa var. corymbosa TaxID=529605 RepID=A0AAV1C665_OLDCO|nr:OLC1v1026064C1 [Oldenlandia corymbosa var. corymbosa]
MSSLTMCKINHHLTDVVSSVGDGLRFEFVDSQSQEPPSFGSSVVQDVVKCIGPRPFTQSLISRGLLQPDPLVKHGALKLVLMELKLLDSLISTLKGVPTSLDQKWASLQHDVQNAVQIVLPKPQVLYDLLPSLNGNFKSSKKPTKRTAEEDLDSECLIDWKRLKNSTLNEDNDFVVSGVDFVPDDGLIESDGAPLDYDTNELNNSVDFLNHVKEIWGLLGCSTEETAIKHGESFFFSKLLDALKIFHRALPSATAGSFDFFKFLSRKLLESPTIVQRSLLSLLVDQVVEIRQHDISFKTPPEMYKHLDSFINLVMYSPRRDIKDWAYTLAQAAMFSTGAFDINPGEISTWLLFIPGCNRDYIHVHDKDVEMFQRLAEFLREAVSKVDCGNNLFRYLDHLRGFVNNVGGSTDVSPNFGPFIVCILRSCLKVLGSKSRPLHEKLVISLYVSTTSKYLLETQVEAGLLSSIICLILSEGLEGSCKIDQLSSRHCEWRPLNSLLCFARSLKESQEVSGSYGTEGNLPASGGLFHDVLREVQGVLRNENVDLFKLWPEICYAGVQAGGTTIITDMLVHGQESFSLAFGSFVKVAPFHTLFPFIFFTDDSMLLDHSKMRNLLLDKLSVLKPEHSISAFLHILFCILQARRSSRTKQVKKFEKLCESLFFLAEHILKHLLVEQIGSDSTSSVPSLSSACYIQEVVAQVVFSHPLVTAYLEDPLTTATNIRDDIFHWPPESLRNMAEKEVHRTDHLVLNLLRVTCELLVSLPRNSVSLLEVDQTGGQIPKTFDVLVQKLIFSFKKGFVDCMERTKGLFHLIPTLNALNNLKEFICPFDLFELVDWMFSQIDQADTSDLHSFKSCALSVGLQVASCAFDSLRVCMLSLKAKEPVFDSLIGASGSSRDVGLFEKSFFCICEIATRVEQEVAFHCLLKATKAVKYHTNMGKNSLHFIMASSRLLSRVPLKFLSHCMQKITTTKAELLFNLSEMSYLHLFAFGHLVDDVSSKYSLSEVNMKEADEFFLLLPTILLYTDAALLKFGAEHYRHFENVTTLFWKIVSQGLSDWNTFVSKDIFAAKHVQCLPSSIGELLNLFSSTLLGKAVLLTQLYLGASGHLVEIKERLNLFDKLCPHTSASVGFLDWDVSNHVFSSFEQPLNFANRIIAKIRFCRVLLSLEHCQSEPYSEDGKSIGNLSEFSTSRNRFLSVLVFSWIHIVEKFQAKDRNYAIFRFLEVFVAENILESIGGTYDCLSVWDAFPFEQLVEAFLRHRFEDPYTLKMLQNVLTLLPNGKFSCVPILQRLLEDDDPQISPTILFDHKSSSSQMGVSFTDSSRIMKSFVFPFAAENTDGKNSCQTIEPYMKKLELVKLLRLLVNITSQQESFDSRTRRDKKVKELVLLLLSSYGATTSEIDLEIYNLMNEIETVDQSHFELVAEWDYLWGSAAINVSTELERVQGLSSFHLQDDEVIAEQRRNRFRENLPVEPKLCLRTVHYFPYNRSAADLSPSNTDTDNFYQKHSGCSRKIYVYDPLFILRFGVHGLAMEYIEPLEFASLGLLAVAFMALSSPDTDIRKLGYEAIVKFKSVLERCPKRKDVMRLRLLLSYLQNGIEEECQRIPSITAVFVAEASLILLDSSNHLHSSLSKALMRASGANFKGIPFFQEFFWSCSINFKTERLWMLRLLNSALDMDEDALILVRNSTFQTLLNFYTSPLSDAESKDLIVQMVKKSVRIREVARNLVEYCGMIPWLSSIIASFHWMLLKDQNSFPYEKLAAMLEVANDIISSRWISEWEYPFEPLAEIASHLFRILVGGTRFTEQQTRTTDQILQLLMTTLKLSQKREVYKPHFTPSFESLFKLYQAIDKCCGKQFCSIAEIGLKAILMSTPQPAIFDMDEHMLFEFTSWAISTAIQSRLMKVTKPEAPWCNLSNIPEEELEEDLLSKLLRWLTASVIIGRNVSKSIRTSRLELSTLHSLLEGCENVLGNQNDHNCIQVLGSSIFHLQQLLSTKWELLPSVVSALCLLLFSGTSPDSLLGDDWISVTSLLEKVKSPPEAHPDWRWSFDEPWRGSSLERSEGEKLEEFQACQKLLAVISKLLGPKPLSTGFLSLEEVEKSKSIRVEKP